MLRWKRLGPGSSRQARLSRARSCASTLSSTDAPTKARTYIHQDFVLCALEDVFTPAELTLIEARKEGLVRENRVAFQDVIRSQFVSTVEQAIGRRVRAFYSQIDPGSNTAAEVFLLAPATEPA